MTVLISRTPAACDPVSCRPPRVNAQPSGERERDRERVRFSSGEPDFSNASIALVWVEYGRPIGADADAGEAGSGTGADGFGPLLFCGGRARGALDLICGRPRFCFASCGFAG